MSLAKNKIRLADIAQKVGVSNCTVSLALSDSPRISSKMRNRVRKVARDLNYVPNPQAQSLRTNKTGRIGLIVPELDNPVYADTIHQMYKAAGESDYELTFACTYWDIEKEKKVFQFMEQQVDALVMIWVADLNDTSHIANFAAMGKPVIVLGAHIPDYPNVSTMVYDQEEDLRRTVNYLFELGHRKFGLLGLSIEGQPNLTQSVKRKGILRALDEAGLDPAESIVEIPVNGEIAEFGYEAICIYLRDGKKLPSGIIALNDSIAIGALSAMQRHGVRVPEDVSVIGHDNIKHSAYTNPPLTTLDSKMPANGKAAIEFLFSQLESKRFDEKHQLFSVELIVRSSTGLAR